MSATIRAGRDFFRNDARARPTSPVTRLAGGPSLTRSSSLNAGIFGLFGPKHDATWRHSPTMKNMNALQSLISVSTRFFRPLRLSNAVLIILLAVACACAGDENTSFDEKYQEAYSSSHARILGFEQAQADWGITSSSQASQGLASGQVQSAGIEFSVKNKVPLTSLGTVGQQFEMDLLVPQVAPGWSTLRVILSSQSQQIWYGDLGQLQLAQKV